MEFVGETHHSRKPQVVDAVKGWCPAPWSPRKRVGVLVDEVLKKSRLSVVFQCLLTNKQANKQANKSANKQTNTQTNKQNKTNKTKPKQNNFRVEFFLFPGNDNQPFQIVGELDDYSVVQPLRLAHQSYCLQALEQAGAPENREKSPEKNGSW